MEKLIKEGHIETYADRVGERNQIDRTIIEVGEESDPLLATIGNKAQ